MSPEGVVSLSRALRDAGLECALTESAAALDALPHLAADEAEEVRLGLRAVFCNGREDCEAFDACFWRWWGRQPAGPASGSEASSPAASAPRPFPGRQPEAAPPGNAASTPGKTPDREAEVFGTAYSPIDRLSRRPFGRFEEAELREVDAWIDRLVVTLSTRRSRRLESGGRRGAIDLRRTLRAAIRSDGELIRLARRRRRLDPPRLVVLCDVSGSMERYSRFLMRFLLACGRTEEIETFAFSTRLTHLTPWLVRTDVDPALDRLRARGWSSGTRIGACLETFTRKYGSRMLGQRTLVIILSDGLDQGETEPLEVAMRRIHKRARRVIWLNPLLESSRYAPEARGMRAALPFIDHFQSGHSLEALRELPSLLRL